ncbi:MAG TPA: phosphatase [Chloroflexi bacterium]|nr:phosphatase [Chloroflexota bacterium]
MIWYVQGNLFQSPAQTLVNTVNTVGVMGKGVALEFKRLFPEMYAQYRDLCERGQFKVGQLWLYKSPQKWVLNFPTKEHWRQPSRVEYVEAGLRKFVEVYSEWGIHSIAFPPLGCGNGQLDFATQVRPLMERYLRNLPIDVFIYPHIGRTFVEHLDAAAMEAWLHSEPSSLPFTEVWRDLEAALSQKSEFRTQEGHPFTARITSERIEVNTEGKTQVFDYETLLAFWQQLRTLGFSMSRIAPGLDRELAYLIPIFSELPYVAPVRVSEQYQTLRHNATLGVQFVPAAQRPGEPRAMQLALFSEGNAWQTG